MIPIKLRVKHSEDLVYELTIRSKVTVLDDESAVGKSILIEVISDRRLTGHNPDVVMYNYTPNEDVIARFAGFKDGTIVCMDEESVNELSEAKVLNKIWCNKLYFVFVTREPLTAIRYSYRDIYKLQTKDGVTKAIPKYPLYNKLPEAEKYATEDEGSGLQYWSNYLDTVITTKGNTNYRRYIEDYCLILDGACVGAIIRKLEGAPHGVMLPPSFEYLILHKLYKGDLDKFLIEKYSLDYVTLEQLCDTLCCDTPIHTGINYNKGNLHPMLYNVHLIPDLVRYRNKRLTKLNLDIDTSNVKASLNKVLTYLGFQQEYENVLGLLPQYIEAETFVSVVIQSLKLLGYEIQD